MKRNYTVFFLLVLLAFLFVFSFPVSAEEYKPMIRYDRVWEHIYVHWNDTRAYHVRFTGTEEINGKTYHRLEAFREIYYTYDYDTKPKVLSVNNDYYAHEGYLREEDGKVYTLIVKDNYDNEHPLMDLYIPDGGMYGEQYTIEDMLLYDFTCGLGESYGGLHLQECWVEDTDYRVNSITHIEIDGEDHILQRVGIYDKWIDEWVDVNEPIVEGIGIASYGCLTTINFLFKPTCPCMNHIFNRVLSTDGKVLYRAEDGCVDIPLEGLFGVNGIEEIAERFDVESPCYDVYGRRIAEPVPGQLYIQGGRKFIGK